MKKCNTHHYLLRRLFLVTLALLLAGCNSIRFGYDHGDTLLYWWLNGYVDFDADQKAWVKQDIDHLLRWHRQTQLRGYAQLLAGVQRQLQGRPTEDEVLADYADINRNVQTMLLKATPQLAELARSLRPEQIANIDKKFAKNNDNYRKKFLRGDRAERQRLRYEATLESLEQWFGSFSRAQEALIRAASDARPLDNQQWLDERVWRQRGVIALLQQVQREKLDQAATVQRIEALIGQTFGHLEQPDRKAFFDADLGAIAHIVVTAAEHATPAQQARAAGRLQEWIDDFNTLAAEAR